MLPPEIEVGVTAGKLIGFDNLDSSYSTLTKLYLLSFLGYDANPTSAEAARIGNDPATVKKELERIIATPPGDIKVLGGVIHSRPSLISYGARINKDDKDANGDGVIGINARLS